jgi:hypothetical protein
VHIEAISRKAALTSKASMALASGRRAEENAAKRARTFDRRLKELGKRQRQTL